MTDPQTNEPPRRGRPWLVLLPLLAFAAIAAVFGVGLFGDPARVPSALIGKPAPQFSLPALAGASLDGKPVPGLSTDDLKKGEVTLVNVFASWCVPCRDEHPILLALAKEGVRIVGINYKDEPENALRFLGMLGIPYQAIGTDVAGRTTMDWGVYGVPETFVVDGSGKIRYKHIGPITPEAVSAVLRPQIEAARSPLP
ncbi:MAG: DsbE family thiol:disulfide interchange protein [Hyphomicrobiales bacterium]|jgi:cytochrome c biogenesis protein CcmG/thiol:disulfide interchange protein DsbE